MKKETFLWAWHDAEFSPDTVMTRERLARMMRAWRREKMPLCRLGAGHYSIRTISGTNSARFKII